MKGRGEKLSRKQESAISALLVHPTMAKTAAAAGVGEVTLWRWLQLPQFKDQYRAARREAVSQTMGQMQTACSAAVAALVEVFGDVNSPATARVSAARVVLEMALKAIELDDLEARVAQLELQVAAG